MNEMGFRPNQNRTTSYSPLIVFSLFNVLKEREKKIESHIDIFIPFFAHILLEKYSNQTTIAKNQYSGEIQQFIKKEYSLQFPIHVVTEVFKRIRRYNLIQFKENEII